jgi:hypothetical protein
MRCWCYLCLLVLGGLFTLAGCGGSQQDEVEILATFPFEDLEGLANPSDEELTIDGEVAFAGEGSLHIDLSEKRVVPLIDLEIPEVENCRLTWVGQMKCIGIFGYTCLEMWCDIPGVGERFGRDLATSIDRVTDWTEARAYIDLAPGHKVDRVRLNLVVTSGGHVWVDDLKLMTEPLPPE